MLRKQSAILTLVTLLLTANIAQADAPESQFGFQDWPYRNETHCNTPLITTSPTACPTAEVESTQAPEHSEENGEPVPTMTPDTPTYSPTATPGTSPTATATREPSMDDDYTTVHVSAQEQNAWNLLNQDRAANGLGALPLDGELSAIARKKSEDMRDKGYFAHESPTYGNASSMLKHFGYAFTSVGENIAHHATVEKSQAAFLSSPGHRRNMLSSSWTRVGIGVCYDANGFVYVTQLFVR